MRLINSDGQITDAKVIAEPGGSANRNTQTIIDNGKYIAAVAICAVIAGASAVSAFHSAGVARDVDINYQVLLNHETKIESRLEYVESELKELRHAEQR